MRDIMKQAEKGRAILEEHKRAQLSLSEINEFYKIFNNKSSANGGLLGVIGTAFEMGVAVGARNGCKKS